MTPLASNAIHAGEVGAPTKLAAISTTPITDCRTFTSLLPVITGMIFNVRVSPRSKFSAPNFAQSDGGPRLVVCCCCCHEQPPILARQRLCSGF